jgi:hypothetical protein
MSSATSLPNLIWFSLGLTPFLVAWTLLDSFSRLSFQSAAGSADAETRWVDRPLTGL